MSDVAGQVCGGMSDLTFIRQHYPMLTDWGVRDTDVMVHSLGCSVWNALGQALGFMAVAECPVPAAIGADIRTDSTWFCKQQQKPLVVIEFERFDGLARGQQKLEEKVGNLMEAAARWQQQPILLILSVWSQGVVSAPDTEGLLKRFRLGFKSASGVMVEPPRQASLLFNRFIFERMPGERLRLQQLKCSRLM